MSKLEKKYICLNCEAEDFRFTRGYCSKCYPLILKIEKIEKNNLPDVLQRIKDSSGFFEEAKKEYIRQIKRRLEIIKDSRSIKKVTAHDLEFRINETLKLLDNKSLGKINDPIASYLKDDNARAYVYQLFSKIQILKPFKIDYYRIYEARKKNI